MAPNLSTSSVNTPKPSRTPRQLATKEIALLSGFLFLGLLILPIVIYFVGQSVFGEYAGHGYGDFFGTLSEKVRNGNHVAWFLILSPYIGWQVLRLSLYSWKFAGRRKQT
jgi:hypothetical protein